MDRKIIIASHGELAKGFKSAAKLIVGKSADEIETYCLMPGQDPSEFTVKIATEVENNSKREYVILTDLFGASVNNSMTTLLTYSNVYIFASINLAILLDLLLDDKNLNDNRSVEKLEESKNMFRYMNLINDVGEEEDF